MQTSASALPLAVAVRSPEGEQEVSVRSPTDGVALPAGWPPTGTIFHLTIETADGFEHNGLPSDGSALSTKLNPKWLRKPLQNGLIASLLDELNGEI